MVETRSCFMQAIDELAEDVIDVMKLKPSELLATVLGEVVMMVIIIGILLTGGCL